MKVVKTKKASCIRSPQPLHGDNVVKLACPQQENIDPDEQSDTNTDSDDYIEQEEKVFKAAYKN